MTAWDYIVVGGGSTGCVVASRLTEDRRSRVLVLEAGGSDRSLAVFDARRRACPRIVQSTLRLGLQGRARPHTRRARRLHAARQGAGRHQRDQRHVLLARPAGGLRRLGCARLRGLGFRERTPLLQALGEQRERRRRLSRLGWPALGLQHPHPAPAFRRLSPGLRQSGHQARGRYQHAAAGRRRLRARHPAQGAAAQHGARLPQAGDAAPEPAGADSCPHPACAVRRQTRDRGRIHAAGPHRAGGSNARGDRLRRHVCLATAAHALGRGSGGAAYASSIFRWFTTCQAWARTCRIIRALHKPASRACRPTTRSWDPSAG